MLLISVADVRVTSISGCVRSAQLNSDVMEQRGPEAEEEEARMEEGDEGQKEDTDEDEVLNEFLENDRGKTRASMVDLNE